MGLINNRRKRPKKQVVTRMAMPRSVLDKVREAGIVEKAEHTMIPNDIPGHMTRNKEFEVRCLNAFGLEQHFDEGLTYIANSHPIEVDMIRVFDRFGSSLECMANRFEMTGEDV